MKRIISILMCCTLYTLYICAAEPDTVFTSQPLPDHVFQWMQGKSWKKGITTISRNELRYLRLSYCDADGETRTGEMVCNQLIAKDLVEIFRELWKAGYKIERMQLVDDFDADDELSMTHNNTCCFNYRYVAGTTVLSEHATGMAVDINPLYNPCVSGKRIQPKAGAPYAKDRKNRTDIPYKIDRESLVYKLFLEHNFHWGGDWRSLQDYQHFQRMK